MAYMFDPGPMAQDYRRPDHDRLLVARISGIAMHHARWHEPTESETAAAVAKLREAAGDRPDLLAEEAGILLGFYEGGLNEPRARAAAGFCIAAGADVDRVARWTEEGRRRAEAAEPPPFSRPGRPPRRPLGTTSILDHGHRLMRQDGVYDREPGR
jgi:hypothetical protein